MQDNKVNLDNGDIDEGSVISIRGCEDVFLVESCRILDSSDKIMLRMIGISGFLIEKSVCKNDIIFVSAERGKKESFFHPRKICPLCASPVSVSRRLFSVRQLFWDIDVLQCMHCGMAYKAPLASPRLLNHIYTQNYQHHVSTETKKETIDLYRSRVERLGVVSGRHLDYGCGAGRFVEACLNSGWDSYGADPYLPALPSDLPVAGRLFKIDATDPELLSIVGKYDCISIWAAVEHLTQFKVTIAGLVRLLNPGGTIVFNSPNAHSLIAKYSGNHWRMATLIEHVQFCTPQAINYIAAEYGLTVNKLRICGSPFPLGRANGTVDQGLVLSPFSDNRNTVNKESEPDSRKRIHIMSFILRWILGVSGERAGGVIIRQLIHFFKLGDHLEVTLKLKY